MYKYLLFFLCTNIFSQNIEFTQNKYLSAFDRTVISKGKLSFEKNKMSLYYENDDKTVHLTPSKIIISTEKRDFIYDKQDKIELSIFLSLIQAIFNDDEQSLKKSFILSKNSHILLQPKEFLENIIKKIEYKKDGKKLIYLNIYFVNKNRINIVEN